MSFNQKFLSLRLYQRILIASVVIFGLLVLLQNPQIFPGAVTSLFQSTTRDLDDLPSGVESYFIATSDNEKLELWRYPTSSKQIVLIFHGNAGDVVNFFPYQEFFKTIGLTSYGFDYRGYGKSTGWPTDKGLYLDGEAVVENILLREKISPKDLIIVGISIGSGPATYIAHKYQVGTLLLYAPFKSLKEAVKSTPGLGFLHPFLIYDFLVSDYMKELQDTCLIIANGKRDTVIPYQQGQFIFDLHRQTGRSFLITEKNANHNDIMFATKMAVGDRLKDCRGSQAW